MDTADSVAHLLTQSTNEWSWQALQHGDVAAALGGRGCRLQTDEAGADHHQTHARLQVVAQGTGVVQRTQGVDAGEIGLVR